MKKIIALILVIGCMLALVSCNRKKDNKVDPIDEQAVADVQAKLNASAPCGVSIDVTLTAELGKLNSNYDVVYNEDGTATVAYSYEKFNMFDETSDITEAKTTREGTVTIDAEGNLSEEVAGTAFVESVTFNLNLDASKLLSANVVPGTLSAKVAAENTATVLGVAIGYDVDLVISTGIDGVNSVAITYTTPSGVVDILATYTYPIPVEEETEEGAEGEEEGTEEGSEEAGE